MTTPTPAALRALRTAAGLSRAQLAALAMASPRTVEKWEQGERAIPPLLWHCLPYWLAGRPAPAPRKAS